MMLVITCLLMLVLMLLLMLLLLTRCRVRVLMLVLLVRQSFVVHGGLEAQLLLVLLRPGLLLLLLAEGVVEGGVLVLLAGIGVGVEEGGGEVEQGVLLGEVEVVHLRVERRSARNILGGEFVGERS